MTTVDTAPFFEGGGGFGGDVPLPAGDPNAPPTWGTGITPSYDLSTGQLGTTGGTSGGTVTDTTGTGSAKAILTNALGQLGLQGLADWAWAKYQAGESFDQIYLEMRQTPEYKPRFPYME